MSSSSPFAKGWQWHHWYAKATQQKIKNKIEGMQTPPQLLHSKFGAQILNNHHWKKFQGSKNLS
jgi:hypothetical protein